MGTIKSVLYNPEDINYQARERVKEWDMKNRQIPIQLDENKKLPKGGISGFIFFLLITGIFGLTYLVYF